MLKETLELNGKTQRDRFQVAGDVGMDLVCSPVQHVELSLLDGHAIQQFSCSTNHPALIVNPRRAKL